MPERVPDVPPVVIPSGVPVLIDDRREAQPKLQTMPVIRTIPREVEPVWIPTETPVAAALPKPVLKPIEEPKPQPVSWTVTPPAPHLLGEAPWWLMEAPKHADPAMPKPSAPRVGTWHSAVGNGGPKPAVAEVREEVEAAHEAPTRLSGLKGILFSLGVKDLSPKKSSEQNGNRSGNGNGIGAHADAAPVDPEQTIALEALAPLPEHEPVEAKRKETTSSSALPRWVTAEPEFLPPPVAETEKGKESRWNRGSYESSSEDIQILPARRGQYKR